MAERMICGLGNPGPQYATTRHNAGFIALDSWVESHDPMVTWRKKFDAEFAEIAVAGKSIVVIKPMTFMNRSGKSYFAALKFYGLKVTDTLVIHDEIELPFGELRGKDGGGHKGHNGLRDIIALSGSPDFSRVRFGVGRPVNGGVADYVLSAFSSDQKQELPEILADCNRLIDAWVEE